MHFKQYYLLAHFQNGSFASLSNMYRHPFQPQTKLYSSHESHLVLNHNIMLQDMEVKQNGRYSNPAPLLQNFHSRYQRFLEDSCHAFALYQPIKILSFSALS